MSISQTQIKGSVILASDAGSNTTIGNTTGTTDIIGITNINATSGINTTIGGTNSGTVTIRGTSINIGNIGNNGNVNLNVGEATSNTRQTTIGNTTGLFDTNTALNGKTTISKLTLNQPITVEYATIQPPIGFAGLNQIGGKDVYRNNAGGTGFFTTTGTTRQVYAFFNNMPTGRYIVSSVLVMNTNVVATSVEMKTVYNTNTSPSFPQPLTLNQSLTLGNTLSDNCIELVATKPNTTTKFSVEQTVVIDVSSDIGNQLGLALTFGTATVGASNSFSLYLNFIVVRIG